MLSRTRISEGQLEQTSATLLMGLKQDGARREIAWAEFRRRYAPIIAGFARKRGVLEDRIDDLIQEVMIGFYAAQPRFVYDPSRGRFRGYLMTCVVHAMSKRANTSNEKLPTDRRTVEQIDPPEEVVESAWEESWEAEHLRRALELVRHHYEDNPTFRAFHRVAVEGRPAAEVAQEFSMNLDTVYQAKSRCMARLRSTLSQLQNEEG